MWFVIWINCFKFVWQKKEKKRKGRKWNIRTIETIFLKRFKGFSRYFCLWHWSMPFVGNCTFFISCRRTINSILTDASNLTKCWKPATTSQRIRTENELNNGCDKLFQQKLLKFFDKIYFVRIAANTITRTKNIN